MDLFNKIEKFFKNCRAAQKAKNAAARKRLAEYDALDRFNIGSYDNKPVIIYNNVVISSTNSRQTAEELIKTMLELREIYVKNKIQQ